MKSTVACPQCNGVGVIYPKATAGMWAGLVPFEADPEPCELCDGTGEVTAEDAAMYEAEQVEQAGTDFLQ